MSEDTDTPGPKVVEFPVSAVQQPVVLLRHLANRIENGDYGDVTSIGVALFGNDELEVFGGGADSAGPTIALLFQGAIHRFAEAIARRG